MQFPRKHTNAEEGYAKTVLIKFCAKIVGWLKNIGSAVMPLQVYNRYNQNSPVERSISLNHYNSDIIYKINDVAYHGRVG